MTRLWPHFPFVHWEISFRLLRVHCSLLTAHCSPPPHATLTSHRSPRPAPPVADPPIRRTADPFLLAWIRIPSNCPKGSARSFQPRGSVPESEAYVLCQELLTDPFGISLDSDFGNLTRFSPAGTPGVIWLQARPPTEPNIRSILGKWLPKLSEVNLYGQLAVMQVDKLRIRGPIEE